MDLIADGLLIATALTAGVYCLVLSRRLRNLTDSGGGIGGQIKSLDKALSETRNALNETRESVGELQASAKSALSQLSRETAAAADLAGRVESGVARAEATMQRLYQAETRIEAHERRLSRDRAGPGGIDSISAASVDGPGGDEPGEPAALGGRAGHAATTRVELPEGVTITAAADPGGSDPAGTGREATREAKAGRGGAVLKAERMML